MQMIAAVTIGSGNRAETFEEAEGLVPFPAHMVVFEAIRSESVDTAMIFKMAFFFFVLPVAGFRSLQLDWPAVVFITMV